MKWLFDPFFATGVYLILVTFVIDRPGVAPGLSIACATVPFQLVIASVVNGLNSVQQRHSIVLNTQFDRTLIPLAGVITEAIAFGAAFVLLAAMMAIYGVAPTLAILWLPVVIGVTLMVAVAVAYPVSLIGLWYSDLRTGEAVALVGRSGAGKTTLLRTIAGVFVPDAGTITVEGRIGALLSIGAGVMSPLTGRENAQLLGVLAGLSRRDVRHTTADVQAASGLGSAFDRPVASYSQGMRARLGYATAAAAEPTILLLDEVHEALDHEYRAHVLEHAREIIERGGIVIAAGHDHPLLERLASRALWLEQGRIVADGPFASIHAAYLSDPHPAP